MFHQQEAAVFSTTVRVVVPKTLMFSTEYRISKNFQNLGKNIFSKRKSRGRRGPRRRRPRGEPPPRAAAPSSPAPRGPTDDLDYLLAKSASIQPRTSLPNFAKRLQRFEKCTCAAKKIRFSKRKNALRRTVWQERGEGHCGGWGFEK